MSQYNKGFSLLEVLISVVVLSFGLLAIAALQINSKAAGYGAVQRSLATQLAQEISEKMRANPVDFGSTAPIANYVGTYDYNNYVAGTAPATDCTVVTCNAAQLAAYDLWEWQENLNGATVNDNTGGLEMPIACITEPAGADTGFYRVSITWNAVNQVQYTGASQCGNIQNDGFRRIIEMDVFVSKEGLGVYE